MHQQGPQGAPAGTSGCTSRDLRVHQQGPHSVDRHGRPEGGKGGSCPPEKSKISKNYMENKYKMNKIT